MPRFVSALLVSLLGALALPSVARAHDPYEITADFRSDAKHVELRVTFARLTALKVASPETGGRKQFGPQQFEEVRSALERCARRVVGLQVDGGALPPVEVTASLTPESDIAFRLVYDRPAADSTLRFEAAFLRELEDPGFAAVVQWIQRGRVVRDGRLNRDSAVIELKLPPES